MNQNKQTKEKEILIVGSIRAQIMESLKDGKEKSFSQIVEKLGKNDIIVSRELKKLVKLKWVIHKGKRFPYKLDITKESVKEYLTKLAIAPHANWDFQEVSFDPQFRLLGAKEIYESLGIRKEVTDYLEKMDLGIKKLEKVGNAIRYETNYYNRIRNIRTRLKIYAESEPSSEFTFINTFTYGSSDFNEIACLIERLLAMRAIAYLKEEIKSNPDIINNSENIEAIKKKSWDKKLKLIISYNP